jgi:DNA-directed RNA polymerase specialized sigma24 family protein
VLDGIFEQSFSATCRLAAVRAATTATLYHLPTDSRRDLEQEALLELWRKSPAYDPRRGSWRTFSERVVANRMTSLMRRLGSERSGHFREEPIANLRGLAAPTDHSDLRTDVLRILARVSTFDRNVALNLVDHSAIETSQRLRVSRATVYRAIGRLRVAFITAGLTSVRDFRRREVC